MNGEQFFLWLQDEQKGPFSADEIQTMVRGGVAHRESLIRAKGNDKWFRIAEISFDEIEPEPREKQSNGRRKILALGAVVLIGGLLIVLGSTFLSPKQSRSAYDSLVLAQLRAPATAKITWTGKESDGNLHGYVDSQNSFGAVIRSQIIVSQGPRGPQVTLTGPNPRSTGP